MQKLFVGPDSPGASSCPSSSTENCGSTLSSPPLIGFKNQLLFWVILACLGLVLFTAGVMLSRYRGKRKRIELLTQRMAELQKLKKEAEEGRSEEEEGESEEDEEEGEGEGGERSKPNPISINPNLLSSSHGIAGSREDDAETIEEDSEETIEVSTNCEEILLPKGKAKGTNIQDFMLY